MTGHGEVGVFDRLGHVEARLQCRRSRLIMRSSSAVHSRCMLLSAGTGVLDDVLQRLLRGQGDVLGLVCEAVLGRRT